MTLYRAMSAVKRRELEEEVERLRKREADLIDDVNRTAKIYSEEIDKLRAEVGQLHVLRAENAELRALVERVVGSSHLTSDTRRSTLDEVRERLTKPGAGT